MFKVNNRNTRCDSGAIITNLNIFDKLFWDVFC